MGCHLPGIHYFQPRSAFAVDEIARIALTRAGFLSLNTIVQIFGQAVREVITGRSKDASMMISCAGYRILRLTMVKIKGLASDACAEQSLVRGQSLSPAPHASSSKRRHTTEAIICSVSNHHV